VTVGRAARIDFPAGLHQLQTVSEFADETRVRTRQSSRSSDAAPLIRDEVVHQQNSDDIHGRSAATPRDSTTLTVPVTTA
jgi:hypothetical protein